MAHEQARERLLAAIDRIDADVASVALWAFALSGFVQPVPHYAPDDLHSEYIRIRGSPTWSDSEG
jgi:hypothetical protein